MAGFDENLVREYFELNGFLVRQLNKYQVHSRRKRDVEEIDLLVQNPAWKPSENKPGFQLFANDLPLIRRAIVAVMGWHTSRLTPSMLKSGSKIHDFLRKEVIEVANEFFSGYEDAAVETEANKEGLMRVLVLPSLPANDPLRSESIKQLQENGVDAILTFPSILENLLHHVETNLSYQKSDMLQMIRLLKIYDMVKSPQGELFETERYARARR
ncbi:MAG TPA: hypothetical protein VK737_00880 [Opitutales bacterium]|jgi:hypothetical protein|nr:hypothetical protein [Opitutales bacterium]